MPRSAQHFENQIVASKLAVRFQSHFAHVFDFVPQSRHLISVTRFYSRIYSGSKIFRLVLHTLVVNFGSATTWYRQPFLVAYTVNALTHMWLISWLHIQFYICTAYANVMFVIVLVLFGIEQFFENFTVLLRHAHHKVQINVTAVGIAVGCIAA